MDAQRALLDELMGAARNLTDEERRGFKEIKWDDREVCAFYMVRFCPHDLFVNTKSDLGACSRIHDPKLKESFENSPRHDSYVPKFEAELVQFCEKLVNDLDRKVRRGQERLAQELEPPPPPSLSGEKAEQLSVLEEKIKNLLEQVEALGEEGKVDEAEALMRKVEGLNTEKAMLVQRPNDKVLAMVQEKKMALCDVCGSFLVSNDAVERTQSHVTGKQHVGYGLVRDFLAEQKAAKDKGREEVRLVRGKEADDKRKPRERESETRRSGSSDRERERYRDRDRDRDSRHRDHGRNHRKPYDRRSRSERDGRDRSRSRSPRGRSGHRRVSRSPVRQY
ncbi:Arginine-aspartate-rich RNA binding protein-like [Hirschfeldia incana]|nr:Arginine-aspartate-rich RNA binding protein-like [Hirschfeldia incana]KAJ0261798.1 Arginine-aspartate-rich RNA binding protein-like [Hirschfeldia incana]KAJ0261799.1 Arginine-aspartate-rich RNA binding protein-like [Hirschfeldia incana]KAJ0261800.1 Arginine-aspartate-rich RNA binding protein-like [Hirschfeldia incana]